jgi:Tfp pilus assembly protein PilF
MRGIKLESIYGMGLFDGFKKGSKIKDAYEFYSQGKYQEALKCYDEILGMDPNYVKAWYGKGVVLGELGEYQDALEAYDKALNLIQLVMLRGITKDL